MLRLPDLQFHLPEWRDIDFRVVQEATQKVAATGGKAGKGSDAFQVACKALLGIVLRGEQHRLSEEIHRTIDVRAFTYLLSASDKFAASILLTEELLTQLLVPRSPMSKLSLVQLVRSYFTHFDKLVEAERLPIVCDFIKAQLAHIDTKIESSDVVRFAKLAGICFSPAGPSNLVSYANNNEMDFDTAIDRCGLRSFSDGRFLTLCRFQYYLETLKKIPVGSDDPVLSEVVKPEVANAPFSNNMQLGHAILEILIDRSAGRPISQSWQSAILSIAGDPRVPKTSRNFQQWWVLLGEKRIGLMRGWLSRLDLKLFLQLLEQSAKDGSVSEMERMFESRKIFMEGLVEQGLVTNSRLFLSAHAEAYLKSNFNKDELPEYARVSSPQTSMIYLNIADKVHMIEGSHSFKLKLLDSLPSRPLLLSYEAVKFEDFDFRNITLYERKASNQDGIRDLTHDVHLHWQHKAIQFLSGMGVPLDASKMISPKRYREFKEKFGVF